jgi:hypothetical protein
MPPLVILVLTGVLVIVAGALAVRFSGAELRLARRLAGARQVRVGELLDEATLPARPVRVAGRIRCPQPIITERGDRLIAFHRDVQVKPPRGTWRSIERIRESRAFELWDHDGSMPVDPSGAAEPLVVLPHIWRGTSTELTNDAHRASIARLGGAGEAWAARSVTRMVSVVDRLLILATVHGSSDGALRLMPPPGGYVICGLELDDAMRLLAGKRQVLMLAGYVMGAVGALLVVAGIIGLVIG